MLQSVFYTIHSERQLSVFESMQNTDPTFSFSNIRGSTFGLVVLVSYIEVQDCVSYSASAV